jgi:plasmid stabilization system protein ParE
MNSYSFSDTAIRDLDEICNYIAVENSKAASQLFDLIRQKCKLVAIHLKASSSNTMRHEFGRFDRAKEAGSSGSLIHMVIALS